MTITDRSRDLSVWAVLLMPPPQHDDQQPGSSSHGLVARAVARSGWEGGWDPRWPGLGLRLIGPPSATSNSQHPAQALGLAAPPSEGGADSSSSREGGGGVWEGAHYEAARLAAGLGEGRHEMADR